VRQFSVITPTFNRAKYLPRVFESLCKQGDVDFEWVIIDDGSTDNTKEVACGFKTIFEIKYHYQENAGQKAALNKGFLIANSHISLSLDDDDRLLPNALEAVFRYFDAESGMFEHECACLSGLCQYENGDIIGKKFPHDYFVSDHIRYRMNKNIVGDKSEFWVTNILNKYSFPLIPNEKNIIPSILWSRIALKYKTLYVNSLFKEKSFFIGGLSDINASHKYPLGSELYYNECSLPPFSLKVQLENLSEYILFARKNKKMYKEIFLLAKNKHFFALGVIILLYKNIKSYFKKFPFLYKVWRLFKKQPKNWKIIQSKEDDLG